MAGIHSKGTRFYWGNGASPQAFVQLTNVMDMTRSGPTTSIHDTTNHSTVSRHREKLVGLIDDGDYSFDIVYNPDDVTHNATAPTGLEYLFESGLVRAAQIWEKKNDGSFRKRQFEAFVSGMGEAQPVDGYYKRNVKITITTAPADVA